MGKREFAAKNAQKAFLGSYRHLFFKNDKMHMDKEKCSINEKEGKITLEDFAELVKQMRHNQRRYFAQRRPEILNTCKELEKQVDELVAKITDKKIYLFDMSRE